MSCRYLVRGYFAPRRQHSLARSNFTDKFFFSVRCDPHVVEAGNPFFVLYRVCLSDNLQSRKIALGCLESLRSQGHGLLVENGIILLNHDVVSMFRPRIVLARGPPLVSDSLTCLCLQIAVHESRKKCTSSYLHKEPQ